MSVSLVRVPETTYNTPAQRKELLKKLFTIAASADIHGSISHASSVTDHGLRRFYKSFSKHVRSKKDLSGELVAFRAVLVSDEDVDRYFPDICTSYLCYLGSTMGVKSEDLFDTVMAGSYKSEYYNAFHVKSVMVRPTSNKNTYPEGIRHYQDITKWISMYVDTGEYIMPPTSAVVSSGNKRRKSNKADTENQVPLDVLARVDQELKEIERELNIELDDPIMPVLAPRIPTVTSTTREQRSGDLVVSLGKSYSAMEKMLFQPDEILTFKKIWWNYDYDFKYKHLKWT